jgi:hypothetical protein
MTDTGRAAACGSWACFLARERKTSTYMFVAWVALGITSKIFLNNVIQRDSVPISMTDTVNVPTSPKSSTA